METKRIGFFQEETGNYSSTRLMFIIGLSWAMLVSSLFTWVMKWTAAEFVMVFTAIAAVPVGLKLGQKPMETRSDNKIKTE